MQTSNNPYLIVLERNLPRVLSLVSNDSISGSIGIADRRYWAWKTVDFPNASMQSLAGGFARISKLKYLHPSFRQIEFSRIALELIYAIGPMVSKSGGLAESFPGENSFCVTGQVLSEALDAVNVLNEILSPEQKARCFEIIEPLAKFLLKNNETHGIISNHLATSALAMARWANLTKNDKALARAQQFIQTIIHHSNHEGWYREYFGADPGYQSWALSSLAQIDEEAPGLVDFSLINSGMKFLTPFALRNGSFANGAGVRLTNFLMSIGPELLANKIEEAAFLAKFIRSNIAERHFASLDTVDEPNIAPFFNDVVRSANIFESNLKIDSTFSQPINSEFHEGGLYVRHSNSCSAVVSSARGGWTCFAEVGEPSKIYGEPTFKDLEGNVYISRTNSRIEMNINKIIIRGSVQVFTSHSQSVHKLLALRLFMLTFGRWRNPREFLKRLLAKYLIAQNKKTFGNFERIIDLESRTVVDKFNTHLLYVGSELHGAPYHMASYGYWTY